MLMHCVAALLQALAGVCERGHGDEDRYQEAVVLHQSH
jgi:hypothetical protein